MDIEERELGSAGPICPFGASCDNLRSAGLSTAKPFHDLRFREGDPGWSVLGDEGKVAG